MGASILVVDDHPAFAAVLAAFLADEGYRVRTAHDGEEALNEITRTPPDLVVTDVQMPGLDGIRLTQALRARGVLMPIILLSAEGVKSTDMLTVLMPNVTYLPKTVDLDDVLALIERILA
jgi:DNA-binding response OmpR family regulator